MLVLFVMGLIMPMVMAYDNFAAINCGSYDRTMVSTKYANYTSDSYFEGGASIAQPKPSVPDSIKNSADRELVKNHRTTSDGHNKFSYQPLIRQNGKYLIIFTFVETQYKSRGQRIFNINIGQETIHTVDIMEEVGFGKLLHKWVEFQLKDDIIYINDTYPVLNAYNYETHQARFQLQSIKNKAKIEALLVISGNDIKQFLDSFLLNQQEKNVIVKEYLADKYRKPLPRKYRVLNETDQFKERKGLGSMFMNKILSLKALGCILCALFAIHHEALFEVVKKKLYAEKQKKQ